MVNMSPLQAMTGRPGRTRVMRVMPTTVIAKDAQVRAKTSMKADYDARRHAAPRPTLHVGEPVWVKTPNQWGPPTCDSGVVLESSDRQVTVDTGDREMTRNTNQVRPVGPVDAAEPRRSSRVSKGVPPDRFGT